MLAIRDLRGAHNRLGYATLLCSVRFLGTFPETADHVPSEVLSFLRGQLGIGDDIDLGGYFRSGTHERHVRSIRERHGFMHFGDAARARFRLSRWLHAECWAGNERPGALLLVAADWLIEHKVLLPGISTLERLVGRIRERARQRLWRRLAAGLSDAQRAQVADLFERDDECLGGLEILRASPLKRQPTQFAKHLDRLEAVRFFGLRPTPPGGVPAVQLERLARVAKTSKPSAIAALQEPRRTATVAALVYTLETSAQDDATKLDEALVSDLFWEAEAAAKPAFLAGPELRPPGDARRGECSDCVRPKGPCRRGPLGRRADGIRRRIALPGAEKRDPSGAEPKVLQSGPGHHLVQHAVRPVFRIGAMVVPGNLRDSLVILALLLDQETELDPSNVMTDSAANSDSMFGLYWLLGYWFCPRLADIGGARRLRVDKAAQYGSGEIAEGTVNIKLVVDNWEDLVRLAGLLRLGHLKAAGVMRILQTRDRPTTLARALMHLGRLVMTLHVLNYIDDADFRHRILVQLNRQELRHKLARRIYHGNRDVVRVPAGQVPDIRAVVIDLGRLVGSHPSTRQPLPGTRKVWQGLERLNWAIQVRDAIGESKRE